jgi:hypothetical protein
MKTSVLVFREIPRVEFSCEILLSGIRDRVQSVPEILDQSIGSQPPAALSNILVVSQSGLDFGSN